MHLIISTSLNPESRSRILARAAASHFEKADQQVELIDLNELELPSCDGATCYSHPNVQKVGKAIGEASSITLASPIYNYNVCSSCKNLIELTGKAWTDKVVGFLLAAGGQGSYMAVMGIANSLMLDFRSLIIPRFVYATGQDFAGDQINEPEIEDRIKSLVETATRLSAAVAN